MIEHARANPGKVNYGTPGAGTSLHITMEQIAKQKGIKWTQVPFKGGADNMNATARRAHRRDGGLDRLGRARQLPASSACS